MDVMAENNGSFKVSWEEVRKLSITLFAICIMPWGIWVTNKVYKFQSFIDQGDRFTTHSAEVLEYKIKEWHNDQLKGDLEQIKKDLETIKLELAGKK